MTDEIKDKIIALRRAGVEVFKIAKELGISADTVRTYLNRYDKKFENRCRMCEKEIASTPHHKKKIFCSDKCRVEWWNAHQSIVQRKAYYKYVCPYCGKEFTAYGNSKRKYCSRGCYANARRSEAVR